MNKVVKNYLLNLEIKAGEKNRRNILKLLPDTKTKVSLLDLGCNDGAWTLELGKKYKNVSLSGVEIVDENAEKARNGGINVKSFNLNEHFDYEDESFDIVHCNKVIEHLYDTDSFVSEVYRILKTNGVFIVSTVSLSSWHNIFSLLLGYQPFDLANISVKGNIGNPFSFWSGIETENSKHKSWQHLRLFTPYSLSDFLKRYNFGDIKVLTSGYYPFPDFFSAIDKKHSHYFAIRAKKSESI